mmetsp:Transcript_93901/g.214722  ORF Transcript_93901/g.214722 Transcript_93901/m.214722 type:complete len:291 (+) Transcript_93901:773-1645(+)
MDETPRESRELVTPQPPGWADSPPLARPAGPAGPAGPRERWAQLRSCPWNCPAVGGFRRDLWKDWERSPHFWKIRLQRGTPRGKNQTPACASEPSSPQSAADAPPPAAPSSASPAPPCWPPRPLVHRLRLCESAETPHCPTSDYSYFVPCCPCRPQNSRRRPRAPRPHALPCVVARPTSPRGAGETPPPAPGDAFPRPPPWPACCASGRQRWGPALPPGMASRSQTQRGVAGVPCAGSSFPVLPARVPHAGGRPPPRGQLRGSPAARPRGRPCSCASVAAVLADPPPLEP